MKTLLISDVHSNIVALETIWEAEKDCDVVVCLGDLVDYGPHPREVLDWIRGNGVPCVKGNHDGWVAHRYRLAETADFPPPYERLFADHNAMQLDEADITFLETLPESQLIELDGMSYGFTHLYQHYDEIVSLHAYELFRQGRFDGAEFQRLLIGHTHRQAVRYLSDETLWLNPGSVAYRRHDDPDKTAHYAVIENGRFSLRRLAYDLNPVRLAVTALFPALHEEEKSRGVCRHVK